MKKDLIALETRVTISEKLKELGDAFLRSLTEESRAAYQADLKDFAEFVKIESADQVARWFVGLSHGDANYLALCYQSSLRERNLASATVNRRIAALRSLVAFANTIGLISWKLSIGNIEHQSYRDVTGIAPETFKLLLETAHSQKEGDKAMRDIAVLLLMHDLGLRRKEVVGLTYPSDTDFRGARLWIKGKGRSQKEVLSLPRATLASLIDWIKVRGDWEGPVFISFRKSKMTKRPLSKRGLSYLITELGAMIGIKLHPHMLRHTSINTAVELATKENIPLDEVLQFSRHRHIQTLLIYRNTQKNMQGEIASLVSESVKNGKY